MSDTTKSARKSVRLKRQRDGSLRGHWYGQYVEDGKHREINLNVTWRGTPPASGRWSEPEDVRFDASRKKAEAALAAHVEEARHKGRAEHLTERLIEPKTGRTVQHARLDELPTRWRNLGRESAVSDRYLSACDAHFNRFTNFMRRQTPTAVRLYEVTPEDAAAFWDDEGGPDTPELVRRTGHATVDVVLKHYFRPDREQFRAALTDAMPGILTGGTRKRLPRAEELVALAGRIAAGTATEADKERLKKLAAKV